MMIVVSAEPEIRICRVDEEDDEPVLYGREAQRRHLTKSRWPLVKRVPLSRVSVFQDQMVQSQQPA